MTFAALFRKYEKDIENMHFESIDEFKKIADKEGVVYSQGELEQAWAHLALWNVAEDKSLDDDALMAVAGGKGGGTNSAPAPPAPQINVNYNGGYTVNIVNTEGGHVNGDVNFKQKN